MKGGKPEQRQHHDQHQRQEQDRRDLEGLAYRCHFRFSVEVARLTQHEEHRERDGQRHRRREQRLAYVPVEVDAGSGGGKIGRVGQRRRLVAEIGAGDHRACGDGRVQVHAGGDAHETDADGADDCPRAADAGGHDGADRAGGDEEVIRAEQLQAVVHHRHQRAAERPGADQPAHGEQNEDGADAGRDAVRGGLAQHFERVATTPADEHRDHRRDHQRHLVRPDRAAVAEQEVGQPHQQDQAGDRNDRLEQREWLR